MSKVIEQFHADMDAEIQRVDERYSLIHDKLLQEAKVAKEAWDKTLKKIQKQQSVPTDEEEAIRDAWEKVSYRYNSSVLKWKFAREAIRKKMKKKVLDFYQEHPGEVGDLMSLIKDETPTLLLRASLRADREFLPEEARRREKVKDIIQNYSDNDDLEVEKVDTQFIHDVTFSDEALRKYIRLSLKEYLDLLKEFAPDTFQEANAYIDDCIVDKKHIVDEQKKHLSTEPLAKKPTILSVTTLRAKEAIFGVTKVEGATFDPRKNDYLYNDLLPVQIGVGTLKKRAISTIVSIDFKKMEKMGVTIGREHRLTPYDREVHNAISTLCTTGNEYITPQMVYQVLSGNKKDAKMTNKAREEILKSIDKMMFTEIEIDATEEVNVGWNKRAKYKGPLIPSERVEVIRLNGQEVVDCIHLFRNPPLYDYANNKSQIDRVDIKMLNAPVNNTPENIELKGFLLRRITSIKNPHSNLTPVIRYDALYEYLGVTASNDAALKKRRKEIRDRVREILNFWVQEGFILGYQEEKEGKSISKIKIKV